MSFSSPKAPKTNRFSIVSWFLLGACFALAQSQLQAATYTVGAGQTYTTIASVPTLQPGDVVNIQCGTYNEIRQWLASGTAAAPITLQGVCATGRPIIDANNLDTSGNGSIPRGAWEIQGSYYIIQNLEFRNAHNGDNAAGLRIMNANVTVTNCYMDYNDMGIMTSTTAVDNVLVQNTEIAYNGTGDQSGQSHNVYLTSGTTVTFSYCYIHDSLSGENFKSRAHYTQLFYNYIAFGAESEVEGLDYTDTVGPNSNMTMIGNLLVSTPNRSINTTKFINFGQDDGGTHNGTLYLINNTLIAGAGTIGFLRSSASNSSIVAINNIFYGSNNIVQSGIANNITGSNNWFPSTAIMPPGFTNTVTGTTPSFLNPTLYDFDLTVASTARNMGMPNPTYLDGNGVSHSGVPTLEYKHPLSFVSRPADSGLDAGAYSYALNGTGSPDLTITKTHAGNFFQGSSGLYTITVTNSGTAATNGAITMTDVLPSGLTASAISGTGWSCTLSPLSCNRADPIGPGGIYPPITLGVTVAANAPSSLTNVASVSGGGETNGANDTASDVTVISPISAASGTASYVRSDIVTGGSWKGVYGGDGANVIGDTASYPSYVTVTPGASIDEYDWADPTSDPRALQELSNPSIRVASCWFTFSSYTIDFAFKDSNSHQVALYLLDWDNFNGRAERIDILDANGNMLDSRNASNFINGEYMVWNLTGHVVVRITNTNPNSNAAISGIFFGVAAAPSAATAAYVTTDTTTAGSWKAAYGGDGGNVIGDTAFYPSYVTVTPAGNSSAVWAPSTTDSRALQLESASTGRVAACWYSAGAFTLDLNFHDTATHKTALYLLDWDNYYSRTERVDVLDAGGNLLDTRTISNFTAGQYLVWNLSGHVVIRITNTNPSSNAVVSGIFFGAPATVSTSSATFVKADTTTVGNWRGVYGADGAAVIGDTAAYPSYATVTPTGNSYYLWASSTSDVRAPELESSSSGRVAACWFSGSSFSVDVKITDGNTHQVALYLLDWDNYYGRTQRVDVLDSTGNLLDSRTVSSFVGGQYLVWNLAGHVVIRLTNTNGSSNAVMSGLFFGGAGAAPTTSATFVKADATTGGSWRGVYGADGANVIGDKAVYPSYATVTPAGNSYYLWASSTGDARAPQLESASSGRVAACWFSSSSFTIDLKLTDGSSHQVALYLLDWDNYYSRTQRVDILDTSGNVLDTRSISSFVGGQYLVWNLSGHVVIRITNTNPTSNAVVSGIYFR